MMKNAQTKSRYPGIRAFEKNERHVFFGRRIEAKKLYNLVKAKPLVVLFAKSGIGKSSLINAGLEPILEKDYYYVVKIRLQTTAMTSVEMVKNELKPYLNEAKLKTHAKGEPGLWEYLRACEFKKGEENVTPVLVFDQFEEFFEHEKNDQAELTRELADMVSDRLPERVRESLRAIPFRDRSKEQLDWHSPIPVKIVFAIRSDRMSQMDEMSKQIPSILHNRFHLKPLGIDAAREAILEPAALKGEDFDTPPFTYGDQALGTMLEYLKNKNNEIESFQLQLLCRNIERTVNRKKAKDVVVKESDFGGTKGIKSILNNYYEQEIVELDEAERPLARKFIEEGLIVAGRRVGVSEGVEEKSFSINDVLLSKLLASRLIRAENTHLGRSYELSHDTLVAPILQSYEIRRRAEEREEAIQKQKEQDELLAKERKKRRRAMLLAAAGFILFVLAAAAGFYAAGQSKIAKEAQVEAEKSRDSAREALKKVKRARLEIMESKLTNGKSKLELGYFDAAIQDFETILEFESSIADKAAAENKEIFEEARTLKAKAQKSGGVKKRFDQYMEEGNEAYRNGKYELAYKKFREARKLNVSQNQNRAANVKIGAAENELIPKVGQAIEKAAIFIRANSCQQAMKKIKEAEVVIRLLPPNKIPNTDVRKLKELKAKCQ